MSQSLCVRKLPLGHPPTASPNTHTPASGEHEGARATRVGPAAGTGTFWQPPPLSHTWTVVLTAEQKRPQATLLLCVACY